MSDGIYCAVSGAISQQRQLDVVANNVANAGSVGYRGDRVAFREALAQARGPGQPASSLHYVVVSRVQTDTSQGGLKQTGNPLDLALQGDGFFTIETPQGLRYSRAGSFVLDAQGVLRTPSGYPVLSGSGQKPQPITIGSRTAAITVSPDGTVSADGVSAGQLRIVRFSSPDALIKEGATLFSAQPDAAPLDAKQTEIAQGFVETANVNAVGSLNELISANRSFEAFQRVIRTYGQIDDRTARELGA
jgi:flagellar basal-body rod protein FlgF